MDTQNTFDQVDALVLYLRQDRTLHDVKSRFHSSVIEASRTYLELFTDRTDTEVYRLNERGRDHVAEIISRESALRAAERHEVTRTQHAYLRAAATYVIPIVIGALGSFRLFSYFSDQQQAEPPSILPPVGVTSLERDISPPAFTYTAPDLHDTSSATGMAPLELGDTPEPTPLTLGTSPAVALANGRLSYAINFSEDAGAEGWSMLGQGKNEPPCTTQDAEGLTLTSQYKPTSRCVVFRVIPGEWLESRVTLKASDHTAAGIAIVRDEGDSQLDDNNYYRVQIVNHMDVADSEDGTLPGYSGLAVQRVLQAEKTSDTKVRRILTEPFQVDPGHEYTLALVRDAECATGRACFHIVLDGKQIPTGVIIWFATTNKVGLKLTSESTGLAGTPRILSFEVTSRT